MAAAPVPASLDWTERLKPIIIVPKIPPATAVGWNASLMINIIAWGIFIKFAKITINPDTMYKIHIVGVRIVVTFAILLIPPTITIPIRIATTKPTSQVWSYKKLWFLPVINTNWWAVWLIWIMLPPVIPPPIQSIAYNTDKGWPNQRSFFLVKPWAI